MLSKMLRGSVNNTTNPPLPSDPNFNQVSLLLHGDGTNGAQNNTFLDSSTNNFTITRNGNTTQGTNTPFSQAAGYWSNYNPTASYLTVATNAAFTYGLNDFTMECWVYLTTTGAIQYVIDQRNSGTANAVIPAIYVSASNVLTYFVSNAAQITGTTALTVGTWYHVAVSRSTLSTKMFLNGVQEGSTYTDANSYAASRVVIGSNAATAGDYLVGYVSNVRLVNGTGVYTTAFTPPTTPLTAITNTKLLTCQSNYFVDNSSNNFAITPTGTPSVQPFSPFAPTSAYSTSVNGGSMYFDGTGDYLDITGTSNLAFGTGDFTYECWSYLTSNINQFIFSTGAIPDWNISDGCSVIGFNNAYYYNCGTNYNSSSQTLILNAWTHIALVRNGTTVTFYLNGVAGTTVISSSNLTGQNVSIGSGAYTGWSKFNGYLSNFRAVKGTALYTANFTPPTAPLTAITNTSLLLSGTNAGIYDNAIKNDLETVGNAQVSTSVVKYGTGSMKFNGTTDYLSLPYSPQFSLGNGSWTVEFWVNINSLSNNPEIVNINQSSSAFSSVRISATSVGSLFFLCANSGNNWIDTSTSASGTVTTGTWYHIAGVRNGSVFTLYVNGVSKLTYTSTASLIDGSTFTLAGKTWIGATNNGGSVYNPLNGYLDDVRITKGIARYTANFTAPTQAFPNS